MVLEEIVLRLRGRAYELFRDYPVTCFEEFCDAIAQTYLPKRTLESLRDNLYSAKQAHDETCAKFGRRVQGLALDYSAGVRAKYGEMNALRKPLLASLEQEAFIRGLGNQIIKTSIAVLTDKTTRELIQMAESLEARVVSSMGLPSYNGQPEAVQCQICNKMGHKANECPSLRQMSFTRTQPFQQRREEKLFCKFCKKHGHVIEECNNKRFVDERRQINPPPQYYPPPRQMQTFQARSPVNQSHQPVMQSPNARRNWKPRSFPAAPNFRNGPPNGCSPGRRNYQNPSTGLEEDMKRMSIRYVDTEHITNEQDQGNLSGLAGDE